MPTFSQVKVALLSVRYQTLLLRNITRFFASTFIILYGMNKCFSHYYFKLELL